MQNNENQRKQGNGEKTETETQRNSTVEHRDSTEKQRQIQTQRHREKTETVQLSTETEKQRERARQTEEPKTLPTLEDRQARGLSNSSLKAASTDPYNYKALKMPCNVQQQPCKGNSSAALCKIMKCLVKFNSSSAKGTVQQRLAKI